MLASIALRLTRGRGGLTTTKDGGRELEGDGPTPQRKDIAMRISRKHRLAIQETKQDSKGINEKEMYAAFCSVVSGTPKPPKTVGSWVSIVAIALRPWFFGGRTPAESFRAGTGEL